MILGQEKKKAYDIPPKFADIPKYAMANNSTYKSAYNWKNLNDVKINYFK